jgi:hypothetical protein
MSTLKTLAVASALIFGASQLALAQTAGSSGSTGAPADNAAASGGPGTHVGAQKTGSAANQQKIMKNQNGYKNQQQ